jgi:plasmid stabilization system protein ParE
VLLVELTRRALAHLRQASQWWYQNRPAAPFAVEDDFEAGANLLARNPEI